MNTNIDILVKRLDVMKSLMSNALTEMNEINTILKEEGMLIDNDNLKSLKEIETGVCYVYNLEHGMISSRSRMEPLAEARQVFCNISKTYGHTDTEIGDYINRDRSTVLYSIKTVSDRVRVDKILMEKFMKVNEAI